MGKWATGITALGVFLHIFEFTALPWMKMTSIYTAISTSCKHGSIFNAVHSIDQSRKIKKLFNALQRSRSGFVDTIRSLTGKSPSNEELEKLEAYCR